MHHDDILRQQAQALYNDVYVTLVYTVATLRPQGNTGRSSSEVFEDESRHLVQAATEVQARMDEYPIQPLLNMHAAIAQSIEFMRMELACDSMEVASRDTAL